MMRRWMFWTLLLPLFCAGFGGGAKATISCKFQTASPFNFGTLYVTSQYSFSAVGSVNVFCYSFEAGGTNTQIARVCVKLTLAQTQTMINPAYPGASITYGVYTDPQRTKPLLNPQDYWIPINLDASHSLDTISLYGLINSGQYPSAASSGDYARAPGVTFELYYKGFSNATDANALPCSAGSSYVSGGTQSLGVSATVGDGCAIAATPMTFPQQGVITRDVTAESTLTVKCTAGTVSPWVSLDDGVNAESGQRRMRSGAGYINYDLYSDSSRTTRWGATKNVDTVTVQVVSPTGTDITVYGKIPIPASQPAAGTYTDVITATVNF